MTLSVFKLTAKEVVLYLVRPLRIPVSGLFL